MLFSACLIDGEAYAELLGNDVRVLEMIDHTVDVVGIAHQKQLKQLVCSAGKVIKPNRGYVVAILTSMLASRLLEPYTQVCRWKALTCVLMRNPSRLVYLKA